MSNIFVLTTFSSQPLILNSVSVVRQMAQPTCGRETKEHRECHETSSRRAFLLILLQEAQEQGLAGNMG